MYKTIVITGSSRGIGFELTKLFLAQGHRVIALSRNTGNLITLQKKENLTILKTDLSSEDDIQKVSEFIKKENIRINILIHNAGSIVRKKFEDTSTEDFKKLYQVNVFAVAQLTKLFIPFIEKGGHVLGISSMGGVSGSSKFGELAAYSSSKGALIILMEVLAEAYKESSIAFNTLALGSVNTEMFTTAFPKAKASASPQDMAIYIAEFAQNGHKLVNGKTFPISNSTP